MTINVFKIINIIFDNIFFNNTKTFNFNDRVFSNIFIYVTINFYAAVDSYKFAILRSFLADNSLCS